MEEKHLIFLNFIIQLIINSNFSTSMMTIMTLNRSQMKVNYNFAFAKLLNWYLQNLMIHMVIILINGKFLLLIIYLFILFLIVKLCRLRDASS